MASFEYDTSINFEEIGTTPSEIEAALPNWKTRLYEIHKYKNSNLIELLFMVAAKTESEVKQWLHDYQEKSKCTYSIRSTENCSGMRIKFKQRLHCQHNTGNSSVYDPATVKRTRNTNCPSTISVTLRKVNKRYQGKDKSKAPNPEMPLEVRLIPFHNHTVTSALRFRKVCEETKQKLLNLFDCGHTPATALDALKTEIQLTHENFDEILADRSLCPSYMYCYHLYRSRNREKDTITIITDCDEAVVATENPVLKLDYNPISMENGSNDTVIEFIDEKDLIVKGTEVVNEINEKISKFLNQSPIEVYEALEVFKKKLDNINTVSKFTKACRTFCTGPLKNIAQKTPLQSRSISRHKKKLLITKSFPSLSITMKGANRNTDN